MAGILELTNEQAKTIEAYDQLWPQIERHLTKFPLLCANVGERDFNKIIETGFLSRDRLFISSKVGTLLISWAQTIAFVDIFTTIAKQDPVRQSKYVNIINYSETETANQQCAAFRAVVNALIEGREPPKMPVYQKEVMQYGGSAGSNKAVRPFPM